MGLGAYSCWYPSLQLGSLWSSIFQDCAGSISPSPCTNHSREKHHTDNIESPDTRATLSFSSLPSGSPVPAESQTISSCGESFFFSVQTPELPGSPDYSGLVLNCQEEERVPLASTPDVGFNAECLSVSVSDASSNLEAGQGASAREQPAFTPTSHHLAGFSAQHRLYHSKESSSKERCSNRYSNTEISEQNAEEISLASDRSELCLNMPPVDDSGNDISECHTAEEEWGGSTNPEGVHVEPTVGGSTDTREPHAACSTGVG